MREWLRCGGTCVGKKDGKYRGEETCNTCRQRPGGEPKSMTHRFLTSLPMAIFELG